MRCCLVLLPLLSLLASACGLSPGDDDQQLPFDPRELLGGKADGTSSYRGEINFRKTIRAQLSKAGSTKAYDVYSFEAEAGDLVEVFLTRSGLPTLVTRTEWQESEDPFAWQGGEDARDRPAMNAISVSRITSNPRLNFPANGEVDLLVALYGPNGELLRGLDPVDHDIDAASRPQNKNAHLLDVPLAQGRHLLVVEDLDNQQPLVNYRLRLVCKGGPCAQKWFADKASCARSSWLNAPEMSFARCGDDRPLAQERWVTNGGPRPLSTLGEALRRALLEDRDSRPGNTVPVAHLYSTHSAAGPSLLGQQEIFPALADLIARAEHEVDFQMYLVQESDPVEEFLDGLVRLESRLRKEGRHANPVLVRMIVDGWDLAVMGEVAADDVFRQVYQRFIAPLRLDPALVRFEIGIHKHWSVDSLHTKLTIVDGRLAHIGGANMEPGQNYPNQWRDSAYLLRGEIAQKLLHDFDDAWTEVDLWQQDPPDGSGLISYSARANDDKPLHPEGVRNYQPAADPALPPDAFLPIFILSHQARGNPFATPVDDSLDQGFLAAINSARRVVRIQTPNLNALPMRKALIAALNRGVQVQLLLSLGFNESLEQKALNCAGVCSNTAVVRAFMTNCFSTHETAAGDNHADSYCSGPTIADLSRLQIRWYAPAGAARPPYGDEIAPYAVHASHLKYLSVDDQLVIVGSANHDAQSWHNSREVNVAIDDAQVTARWDSAVFQRSWQTSFPVQGCPYWTGATSLRSCGLGPY